MPKTSVKRNMRAVFSGYFPGALVADRAAFEAAPASDRVSCVPPMPKGRTIELPGVVLESLGGDPGRSSAKAVPQRTAAAQFGPSQGILRLVEPSSVMRPD